ncbi:hypothetical protein EV08_0514 [Prochlorococcus marinus str. SS2]|nr:hypothetical protein EV08_0514 [Prochlorococcus marinus str. SS2]
MDCQGYIISGFGSVDLFEKAGQIRKLNNPGNNFQQINQV